MPGYVSEIKNCKRQSPAVFRERAVGFAGLGLGLGLAVGFETRPPVDFFRVSLCTLAVAGRDGRARVAVGLVDCEVSVNV